MTSEQEDSGLFDFAFLLYIGNFSGSLISPRRRTSTEIRGKDNRVYF